MKVWLARNRRNGRIFVYGEKPLQFFIAGIFLDDDFGHTFDPIELDRNSFPNISWSNSPIAIEILPEYKLFNDLWHNIRCLDLRWKEMISIIKQAVENEN